MTTLPDIATAVDEMLEAVGSGDLRVVSVTANKNGPRVRLDGRDAVETVRAIKGSVVESWRELGPNVRARTHVATFGSMLVMAEEIEVVAREVA